MPTPATTPKPAPDDSATPPAFAPVMEFQYGKYQNARELVADLRTHKANPFAMLVKLHNAAADGSVRAWTDWDRPLVD